MTPRRELPAWARHPLLYHDLTPREVEVARLCARGLAYRPLAAALPAGRNGRSVSPHTVRTHVQAIIREIPVEWFRHEGAVIGGLPLNSVIATWVYRVESGAWPVPDHR